jgi:acyl-CoA dehydrogenase family protein 9
VNESSPESIIRSLFSGEIPQDRAFPFPRLMPTEQAAVRRLLATLRAMTVRDPSASPDGADQDGPAPLIDARRSDAERRLAPELLRALAPLGLFGLTVPPAYGGRGLSTTACCRVFQELGALDSALAVTLLSHLSHGVRAIQLFGTEDQKRRYLPALSRGERLCAFAQAEPQSGSDAASIHMRAAPTHAPGGHLGYALNGTKIWVTGGGLADVFVVFAQTEVHREGARVDRITGFLVERGPGVQTGAEEEKLGVRGASTTALYLTDLHVPRDSVLGAVGGGFKVLQETLSSGRLSLSAICIGAARAVLQRAVLHATTRRQFGRLLSSFGMIKDKLGQMQIDLYAAESMLYLTSGLIDRSERAHPHLTYGRRAAVGDVYDAAAGFSMETACCKIFASEMLVRVASEAMSLGGGAAFMGDYPYERALRDSRFFLIFGTTNEILRCYLALSGMAAPGEQLARLSEAIRHPLRGYGLVMDTLLDQVKVAAYGGPALTAHHPRLKREAVAIEDTAEALQKGVDRALRRHGRQISEMQYVQRRVADVTMDLYGMLACVSRASAALRAQDARRAAGEGVEAAGEIDEAERELRLCRGFCSKAIGRVRKVLERFNENDDELMKAIAEDSYHGRIYPHDILD